MLVREHVIWQSCCPHFGTRDIWDHKKRDFDMFPSEIFRFENVSIGSRLLNQQMSWLEYFQWLRKRFHHHKVVLLCRCGRCSSSARGWLWFSLLNMCFAKAKLNFFESVSWHAKLRQGLFFWFSREFVSSWCSFSLFWLFPICCSLHIFVWARKIRYCRAARNNKDH